jgi:hypothetical protein
MAKKKKPNFEKGWRVIAYLPVPTSPGGFGTQRNMARVDGRVGVVVETVSKRTRTGPESWVYVNIEGTTFYVPEADIDYKTDEPYCVEFVRELQQASLVRKAAKVKGTEVVRERIITPTNKKGYLKGLGWKEKGALVNKMRTTVLDKTYQRLKEEQAAAAGTGA